MMVNVSDNPVSRQLDFAELVKKLEQLVAKLERDDISLEAALDAFEEGVELAAEGKARLERAEKRVSILLQKQEKETLAQFEPENFEQAAQITTPNSMPSTDESI